MNCNEKINVKIENANSDNFIRVLKESIELFNLIQKRYAIKGEKNILLMRIRQLIAKIAEMRMIMRLLGLMYSPNAIAVSMHSVEGISLIALYPVHR